jgi:hypothetical protein
MNLKPRRHLIVQLVVDHPNLSTHELEKILALKADEIWQVGDRYKPSPNANEQQYKFTRWALTEKAASLDELTEATRKIKDRLENYSGNFSFLPSDSRIALTLFIDETDSVIGTGFDTETIQFLAKLNAEIDISMLVSPAP